jgi:uncharacterized RDD family membrane protein YckC
MPVKVRCGECGQGISAPDAARGKTLKCKGCGSPVKIPGGGGSESGGEGDRPRRKKKPAKKRPAKKRARRPESNVDDDDFFSKLDLDRAEDYDVKLCPKCAAEVDEEDLECPSCGVNMETGVISERQKLKHSKGPDPDDFYPELWSNSWEFLKENWGLAMRLSLAWSIYMIIFWYNLKWCVVDSERLPLKAFFGFIAFVAFSAGQGSFCQLFTAIIRATNEKQDKMNRFEFDFFTGVSVGIKFTMWPFVLASPVLQIAGMVLGLLFAFDVMTWEDSETGIFIALGVAYAIPIWTFPTAMCHMAAKYTYKAYLPLDMMKFTGKNIKAAMFWWMLTLAVMLIGIGGAVCLGIFLEDVFGLFQDSVNGILELMGQPTDPEDQDFFTYLFLIPVSLVVMCLSNFVFSTILSFPALMSMRACGLYSYYNKRTMGTLQKRNGGDPCGFWIRYLGYMVDLFVVNTIIAIMWGIIFGTCRFFFYLELGWLCSILDVIFYVFALAFPLLYFTLQESSSSRATMGMAGLGITVVDDKGEGPILRAAAFNRAIMRLVFQVAFNLPFIACLFDKEKKSPHDRASQTQVVWRQEFD